ncbi:MAG: ABC transporter permease subunit [Proteobacteria bacterium]|nr:ABC transporter permease subunit [Pseudomonadota bacterium]
MFKSRYYFSQQQSVSRHFNPWDLLAVVLIFAVIAALAWATKQMGTHFEIGEPSPISLSLSALPGYATRTALRMFIALLFSLLFTFTIGTWAAKSKRAEQVIIPCIDVLQSVPVLSFLSITVVGFINLFPGSLLGPECAAIFAIFTSQVWNMALGFYQTVKGIPSDLKDAASMLHLSAWQRFWKIEVPFSMSGLLWNTMMSMSASWFFVVLCEAISVDNQDIRLPGIGSYIYVAITHADKAAVVYAIITMLIVILTYDQLIFRPLMTWSEKYRLTQTIHDQVSNSWVVNLLQKAWIFSHLSKWSSYFSNLIINFSLFRKHGNIIPEKWHFENTKFFYYLWYVLLFSILIICTTFVIRFFSQNFDIKEILHVFFLGTITATRVFVLIALSSLVWIPVGIWIGRKRKLVHFAQPIIQFLAAFPANLIYPIVVIAIVRFHLNVEVWVSPLMILGTQWYILFNVIAGVSALPKELYQATANFGVTGWQWWKRLALPAIFPYYITGAITAAGGAWNASIVAEWVSWGNTTLQATGLGEYIHAYTNAGEFSQVALGTVVMCLFVLFFNWILWRPLYRLAQSRFQLS